MWEIVRYNSEFAKDWNRFVAESRNGTFLFDRGYMDYHSDRFTDCSWMVFEADKLVALLPANITTDGVLHSHGGLTYGGWVLPCNHINGADMLDIFGQACDIWRTEGIKALDYKTMPYIYRRRPAAEDEYALFRLGAKLSECNLSSTIDLSNPGSFKHHLSKAGRLDVKIEEIDDVELFVDLVAARLSDRYDAAPVHTAAELRLLKDRFPKNIRIFAATVDGEVHAAVCMYETSEVAHCQYMTTTETGRKYNLMIKMIHDLARERYTDKRFFDFGISNEDHGRYLNADLLRYKYYYGATGVTYNRYLLTL